MENREIRFRVWNGKEMVYPAIIGLPPYENFAWCHSRSWLHNCQDWSGEDGYIESAVLMQYVGLKDKHGKEVFECDLLKAYPKESNGDHRIYLVSYEAPHFWVENVDKNYPLDVYHLDEVTDIEVIGNSHENTEYVPTEPNRAIRMISKANRNP